MVTQSTSPIGVEGEMQSPCLSLQGICAVFMDRYICADDRVATTRAAVTVR